MGSIKAAWDMKKALDAMAKAKLNAERAEQGLPPLRPWYEDCYENTLLWTKETLIKAFCGCCTYRRRRRIGNTCLSRICADGTHENDMMKCVIGFIGGLKLTTIMFFMFIYSMGYPPGLATAFSMGLSVVLSLGLAFSSNVRCMVFLIIPHFFSSKGRSFLLAFIFVLVVNTPVKNFNHNLRIMTDTMTCGQMVAQDTAKAFLDAALAPLNGILGLLRTVIKTLIDFANQLRHAFLALKGLFVEVLSAIKRVFSWLDSMVDICNENMGRPYWKCLDAFDTAVKDCRAKLSFMSFLCEIPNVVSNLCHVVRLGELLCGIPGAIKEIMVNKVKSNINLAVQNVYDMFYVNVTLVYHYNMTFEASKSFEQIREDILSEIQERVQRVMGVLGWANTVVFASFIWLIIKTLLYRHKFLTKDSFDNYYISFAFRDINERRVEMEKETVLPLQWNEKSKYITNTSIRLAAKEQTKMIRGLVFLGASAFHAGFYLGCDAGLYWLLVMIKAHAGIKVHAEVPHNMKMHVEGDGVLADMYRSLITAFDPIEDLEQDISTTQCLPNPSRPDFGAYKTIGALFGVSLLMIITESYGLRLRHMVAGFYFPQREKKRALWLYNHILKTRGTFLKFMRRKMRKKEHEMEPVERITLMSRLAAKYSVLRKIFKFFGYDQKHCLCCGHSGNPDDMENFKHCDNHGCKAVYCLDCFTDINNMCTVCMSPVDYGDMSDLSEERDSSDQDSVDLVEKGKEAIDEEHLDFTYQDGGTSASCSSSDEDLHQHVKRKSTIELVKLDDFSDDGSEGSSNSSDSLDSIMIPQSQVIRRHSVIQQAST